MKCPNCGAETDGEKCSYCGRDLPKINNNTDNHSDGTAIVCPICGSNRIKFHREKTHSYGQSSSFRRKRGSVGASQRNYAWHTVGVCQNCGATYDVSYESKNNKKNHGCLWWALVILFLPVSLPILFITTDKIKMNRALRVLLVIIVYPIIIITLLLKIPTTPTQSQIYSNDDIIIEATETPIIFAYDEVVNQFIIDYNSITQSKFSNITKGNIRTKYFADSYGYECELLHAANTDKICVTVKENNSNADVGVSGMRDVFHDIVKTIDSSLSDDEIYAHFDDQIDHNKPADQDSAFGTMQISFYRDVDLSAGHYRGWFKIYAQ